MPAAAEILTEALGRADCVSRKTPNETVRQYSEIRGDVVRGSSASATAPTNRCLERDFGRALRNLPDLALLKPNENH